MMFDYLELQLPQEVAEQLEHGETGPTGMAGIPGAAAEKTMGIDTARLLRAPAHTGHSV
jgi:hypothetical protein